MKGKVHSGPAGVGWAGGGGDSSLASGSSAGTLLIKALGVLLPFNLQYFIRLAALCTLCYQCLPPFQNLRFNKLINNLSCVHRRAEVLGNVTRPAINREAGYSDGRQMAPVPSLSWLNHFPGGAFRTRGCFCLGSP